MYLSSIEFNYKKCLILFQDEIVDLLDASASQKIMSRAPTAVNEVKKESRKDNDDISGGFPVDKLSGKMIITEAKEEKRKPSKYF